MKNKIIESIPVLGMKNGTHIDVEVGYSRGGMNYFSGETEQRGYYVYVTPVVRKDGTMSFTLFNGLKKLLLPANRFTTKQFEKAVALSKNDAPEMIRRIIKKETQDKEVKIHA
jgi:hypothetical protein